MNNLDYELMNYWSNIIYKDVNQSSISKNINSSLENFSIKNLLDSENINFYKY